MPSDSTSKSDVSLTYKFLLILSTMTSCFFCYLYVSKPTVAPAAEKPASTQSSEPDSEPATPVREDSITASSPEDFVAPSPDSLPGAAKAATPQLKPVNPHSATSTISLPSTPAIAHSNAWEETNDKVQHVITAQAEDGESERIILEIPVIYMTRGLRFSPAEAKEAERILRALKIYQGQIKQLHQDGLNIQTAWQTLLNNAQPIEALRADSPSLPKSNQGSIDIISGNSADSIKLSNP